jgi:glycosyltransferase involved in cell wall biosynthesis
MAMGIPVVSTSIGIEGLPVQSGRDCFIADTPREFADALIRLFKTPRLGEEIAATARRLVEERFSNRTVARRFEEICSGALARRSHAK